MEKKKPCDKETSNLEKRRKPSVNPIKDGCFKKSASKYTAKENIAGESQESSTKMTKTKKQYDKVSKRTKTTMKFSSPSDSDISISSNESTSMLQQGRKLLKKRDRSASKEKKQPKETNGELSDSTVDAVAHAKKSDKRYMTLSEILQQSSEEKESDSSLGEDSEISKLSHHSVISLKKLSYLKSDLKTFRSKENEKKTPITGEQSLLFKSQMAKALNTFKETCSEFELEMEHVKWRHFKKDLVYRENASNVLSKSRKVITRMKRELENQENALVNLYYSWSKNCSLETLEESPIEDANKCLSEEGSISRCDSDNTSADMFKSILEESVDKDIFEKTGNEEQQNDLEMKSLKETTKKCMDGVCPVKDPTQSNHDMSKDSSIRKELTKSNAKNILTENTHEKEENVTASSILNDEERKKVIPESDSESQLEEFVDGQKKSKRGMESQGGKKDIGIKMSNDKTDSSNDENMIRELESISERCAVNSYEWPSSSSNAKGEEELDDHSANIRAKTALMVSSNSESSSSESTNPLTIVPTSEQKSTRVDRKTRLKRVHSSDSEKGITHGVKKRRTKSEKASCDANEKLKKSCRVVVERLSEEILAKYAQALQKSQQRLHLKAMKNLIDLDRLERNQKDHCRTSSKGLSKKTGKGKEVEDTLLDHLKKVENGEQVANSEEESNSADNDNSNKINTAIQSNEDLLLEADKAIKNILLNSSDSDMEDAKTAVESSENETKKSKTPSRDSRQKTKLNKQRKSSCSDNDKEKEREKSKWRQSKLLTVKLSDSDSDVAKEKCKAKQDQLRANIEQNDAESSDMEEITVVRKRRRRRKILDSDSDVQQVQTDLESDSSASVKTNKNSKGKQRRRTRASRMSSDSDSTREEKKPKPRRKRIKKIDSDSDSDKDNQDDLMNTSQGSGKKGRKNIRKVMKDKQVTSDTKQAAKEEEERINRIAERQKLYNEMYEARLAGEEKVDKLVLDFNPETKEELISVHEDLVKRLKPHQAEGIKFMWDACFESLDRIKSSAGSGCIIAHCMGLGKTLQVIVLSHTLLNYEETGIKTIMVVCPLSTVHNWVNEFQTWLSDVENGDIEVYELTKFKKNVERGYQLQSWQRTGGVLIIGYEMYRNLTGPCKGMRKKLKAEILECLTDPGPDLVVCDEGHLLKNEDTALSKSMRRIKTLRRVVLTGTPLQNNLREYHCMVQFVKPNLLGTRIEFLNRFVNPITNGQFDDSTERDVKLMKKRAYVLNKMLKGCVQRFDYSVLTPFLPPKQEYVIFVSLTEVQIKMYQHYLDNFARRHRGAGGSLFADFQVLQRIWTHPFVLRLNAEKVEKMNERKGLSSESEGSLKDFIDDSSTSDSQTSGSESDIQAISDSEAQPSGSKDNGKDVIVKDEKNATNAETEEVAKDEEWWLQFIQSEHFEDMRISAKLVLLFGILKESEQIGDKVLVFSQSLYSLSLIEHFLGKIHEETQNGTSSENIGGHSGNWCPGVDYFRLDGQMSAEHRSRACKIFNRTTNTRARLFLISTRAGGLGINLTAANRVIIFDASWNPSHDVQSIFRVYRFGQKKPCYVYRFLAAGTMEETIYNRQVTKLSLSCRVVDEQQIERHYSNHDLSELYKFEPNVSGVKPTLNLPKDRLLAEIFLKYKDCVENYHEHDSLLENKADEELDEEERKLAWEEYEDEKKGKPIQPFGLKTMLPNNMISDQYGNISHVTTDYLKLQELIRKDYPNATPEYQKLLTTKALTDMYNYWEQQTVFNAAHVPQLIQNAIPNPQAPPIIYPNTVTPQQMSMVRTVQKIDSNVPGGHLKDILSNTSGYRNIDPSTSGVTDGDITEVLPTTINTATRPLQNAPQLNSKSKNQEE